MPKKKTDYSKAGLVFEELEPRLLLSADPLAVATDASVAIVQELVPGENEDHTAIIQSSEVQVSSSVRNELVIIDSRAPNYQQLHNDLIKQQKEGRNIHVVILDAHRDGIEQINEALESHNKLDAVHIISHGDDGQLQLGATRLNISTLQDRKAEISGWKDTFTDGGDLLIYGCKLAETADGKSLVDSLSQLTATDVAASDDLTGNKLLGGDWELEYEAGDIETGVAFSDDVQQHWQGTLEAAAPAEAEQEQADTEVQQQDQQVQAGLVEQQTTRTQDDQEAPSDEEQEQQAAVEQEQRREIVFIDESVTDFQAFVDDLQGKDDGTTTFEIHTLDGRSDGIEYIEAVLAEHDSVDAVHIYSHGDDAAVKLGNAWLNPNNLSAYSSSLASWSGGLDADADILIYGCNLAETDEGKQFANEIARITGADVAASDDFTGHASMEADWELEHRTGNIESALAISDELQQSWAHVMTVSVDASSSGSTADQASVTVSHTTSGTDRLMLVGVSMEPNAESVSSVSYNGVNLTLIGVESNEPNKKSRVEIWGLLAPELGTHDVIVNLTSASHSGVAVGVMTFTEVNQSDPWLNFTGDSGKSTNPATAINSAAGDLVFGVVAVEKGTAVTPGSGQTEHWDTVANDINGGGSVESGGGLVATSWTSSNLDWSAAAVSIQSMNNLAQIASLIAVQDATIDQGNPTTNSGASVSLVVNRETGKEQRSLVQFDLGSIPPGATIQNAFLKLDSVYHGGQLNLDVYQLLESWSEGSVTWNESSSGTNWSTAGSTFNATVLDSVVANATGEHDWDITGLVQDWLDGSVQNYGVMIDTPDVGGYREIDFDSREGTVAPVLEISYIPNSAPVIASNGGGATVNVNVAENTTAVTTVTATDVDLDTVTYLISGGADAALFNIDANSGVLTFIGAPNFEAPADANTDNVYDVTVQASDGYASDTQAISVTVTDVLELTVTNTNATGTGSLQEAILNANTNTGVTDTITFNIPGAGPHVISLTGALPTITDSVVIDGTTDPDYAGTPLIVLDGSAAGNVSGITLSADNSTIRGLVLNNFLQNGILINGNGNTIAGNYIGVDATGLLDRGNGQDGVQIYGDNNIIGGSVPADRNVFSGNGDEGIDINAGATGTIIQGNYVGTNASGTAAIPNGAGGIGNWGGILVGGNNTTVGGSNPGEGNLVSGNNSWGIVVESNNNIVQGNLIGTQADGTSALGNTGHGIRITDYAGGVNNLIGGTAAGAGNVIANNGLDGIVVTGTIDATILGNTILNNAGTGIDLGDDDVTANDAGDVDTGSNNLQNFPVITTTDLVGTNLTLSGTLETDGLNTQYRIEFYGNVAGSQDATNGEGSVYLGSTTVTTDGSGNAAFSAITLGGVSLNVGDYVTATATRIVNAAQVGVDDQLAYGPTSEFAANFLINNLPVAVDDSYTAVEDIPYTAALGLDDLLLNDSDIDGDTLTVNTTPVTGPSNGALILNSDGTFTYTPDADFNGADSFTYKVNDGTGDSNTATVNITVTPVNDAPADLTLDNTTVAENAAGAVIGNVSVTDADAGDAHSYTVDDARFEVVGGQLKLVAGQSLDFETEPSVSVIITATDAGGLSYNEVFTITVANVNEPPTVSLANTTTSFAEDTDTSSAIKVADIVVSDDALGTNALSLSGADAALFEIVGTELRLKAGTVLDFETSPTLDVSVVVDDVAVGATPDDTALLSISVTNANEAPTDLAVDNLTVAENAAGAVIGNVSVTDADAGDAHSYTVDDARFEVVGGQLKLVAGQSLDFETEPSVSVIITATDAGGLSYNEVFTITVANVNEPPTVSLANTTTSFAEDTDTSSAIKVADIVVSDDALGTNALSLSGADAALFEIVGTELRLKAGTVLDFETSPTLDVSVVVDDVAVGATPDDTALLSISVTNANEAPTDLAVDNLTVAENAAGAVIGNVSVTDADAGDAHSYTVDDARFEVVGGQLKLVAGQSLDFEIEPSVSVIITATDVGGLSYNEAFTITVINVNEAPVVSGAGGILAYAEGAGPQVIDSTLTISDVDDTNIESAIVFISGGFVGSEDVLSFTSTANITGNFNAGTGVLTLTGADTLANYELALKSITYTNTNTDNPNTGDRTITWMVSDGTANSAGVTSTITVAEVNDAPVAGNDVASVNEGGSVIIDVSTTDSDVDNAVDLNSINIIALPANGSAVANSDGTVTYTHNGSETLVDSFSYTISDISGAVSNTAMVSLSINPVNDAPVAGDNVATVAEGNSVLIDLAANDTDADNAIVLNSINIIGAPVNGTLNLNGDGTVTYNHDGSETNSDTFTYTISDISGAISNTATVTITVTPVNDAPTTGGIAGVTVNEDAATTTMDLNSAFNDADNLDSELTYSIVENSNIGLFSLAGIDGTTGQLSLGYAADMNGAAQITIRATDPSGSSVNTIFTVTVTPVNDSPVMQANNGIVATGVVPGIIASSNLSVNDVDNSNSEITYTLTVMPGNGALLLNGVVMTVNDTFTQTDLDSNSVVYQAAGTAQADQFGFTVTDGAGGTLTNNTFDVSIQLAQDNGDDTDTEDIVPPDIPDEEPTQEIIEETGGAAEEEDGYGRGYEPFGSASTQKPQPRPVLSIEPTAVPGKKASPPVVKDVTELKTSELQTFTAVQMKSMDALWSAIDMMKQEMGGSSGDKMSSGEFRVAAAKSSGIVLTAGVVAWVLRSGALLSSLLSTIPLWKGYDPLPILAYKDDDEKDEDEIHEDKIPTSLEELKKLKKLKQKKSNEVDVDSLFGDSTKRE